MNTFNVSVIIPCYNSEMTIEDTLLSLERQVQLPYEVICINDGSTDNTEEKILSYKLRSKLNIKLYSQTNEGVSAARNCGIRNSLGNVLVFLDADDLYSPLYLEMVKTAFREDVDSVYSYTAYDMNKMSKEYKIEKISSYDALYEFMIHKEKCHTSAFAYRKDIIIDNKLLFTVGARYGEDWEFTTKYLSHCSSVSRVQSYLFYYRVIENANSAMKTITYAQIDAIKAAERTESYLKNSGSSFYDCFHKYMYHKALFSVLHNFSKAHNKKLYLKLISDYDAKNSMRELIKNPDVNFKTKLAARIHLISPWLFYYSVGRI